MNRNRNMSKAAKNILASKKSGANSGATDTKRKSGAQPMFEILEPRILYSADALGVAAVLLPDENTQHEDLPSVTPGDSYGLEHQETEELGHGSNTPPNDVYSVELVVIDHRVADAQNFVDEWAGDNVKFIFLENNTDPFDAISDSLEETLGAGKTVNAIKIVSHGDPGSILLGNATIDKQYLQAHSSQFDSWKNAFNEHTGIQLFGCNVAEGQLGNEFVQTLSLLTDSHVQASDDITGHKDLGGDWDLEVSYGATWEASIEDKRQLWEWRNSLATINVSYAQDGVNFDETTITIADLASQPNVSLRMAIAAANNTAGDDVINLTNSTEAYELKFETIEIGTSSSGNLTLSNGSTADVKITKTLNSKTDSFFRQNDGVLNIQGDPNALGTKIVVSGSTATDDEGGVFHSTVGTVLNVSDATFSTNSSMNGGAIYSNGELHINDSQFEQNLALNGGAIYLGNGPLYSISNSEFLNNDSSQAELSLASPKINPGGGAIYTSTPGTITTTIFTGNTSADTGGALRIENARTEIVNSYFASNASFLAGQYHTGGAIYANGAEELLIDGSDFESNVVTGAIVTVAPTTVTNSDFTANAITLNNGGAAIFSHESPYLLTIENSVFHKNSGEGAYGGAVWGAKMVVKDSVFTENTMMRFGAALATTDTLEISNSHFESNYLRVNPAYPDLNREGGAIYFQGSGSITTSSFVDNTARDGSAIFIRQTASQALDPTREVRIERVIFSGNTATDDSTIRVNPDGDVKIFASTFADNISGSNSAGVSADPTDAYASVKSSVFFNNTLTDGTIAHLTNVESKGFNLFDENPTADLTIDFIDPTMNLGAVTSVVGTNVVARPLLAGSIGINAGASTVNDPGSITAVSSQDAQGFSLDGLPDIGASEFQGANDTVYWADGAGKIWRSNNSFSNPINIIDTQNLPSSGGTAHDISGLTVDLNGLENDGFANIYWTDRVTGTVWQLTFDGSGTSQQVVTAISAPSGPSSQTYVFTPNSLALDQDRDIIFLTHGHIPFHAPAIRSWELGAGSATFLDQIDAPDTSGNYVMDNPRDIVYSSTTGRIYWIDGVSFDQADVNAKAAAAAGETDPKSVTPTLATIHSSLFNGQDYQLHHTSAGVDDELRGLVLDDYGEYLFFTNVNTQALYQLHLTSGSVIESSSIARLYNRFGVGDITFISEQEHIVVIDSESNVLETYDKNLNAVPHVRFHDTIPLVVESASTSNASLPSFYTESFDYVEEATPKPINSTHLVINDPSGNSGVGLEFILTSTPTLNGILKADGIVLNNNDRFNLGQIITYENDVVYNVNVDTFRFQITNGSYTSQEKTFSVDITPIDDPAIVFDANFMMTENRPSIGVSAFTFDFTDEEGDILHTYDFTQSSVQTGVDILVNGVVANSFTHDQLSAGQVALSTENMVLSDPSATSIVPVVFDLQAYATNGEPINAQNPLESAIPAKFTVLVTPVNDEPRLSPILQSVNENESLTLTASMFGYSDEESDLLNELTIHSIPTYSGAELTLNGVPVLNGETISIADLNAGLLGLDVTNANATLGDTISFTVSANSADGQSSSIETFTTQITPVNDIPTLSSIPQSVNENSSLTITTAMFGYTDEEGDVFDQLTVVSVPTYPNANLQLNGLAVSDGQQISTGDIAAGLLVLDTTKTDASLGDTIDFTISASSADGQSSLIETLTTQITPLNDTPTLTPMTPAVDEDSSLTLTPAMFGYADEERDVFDQLTVVSGPTYPDATLQLNGIAVFDGQQISAADVTAGLLVLDTTNTDASPNDTIDFTVNATSADGQSSSTVTFTAQITPVNDAPTLSPMTPTVDEDSSLTLTTAMFGYADEEGDAFDQLTIVSIPTYSNASLQLNGFAVSDGQQISAIDIAAGLFVLDTTNTDANLGDTIDFTVSAASVDGQSSSTVTFTAQIMPVNDVPTLSPMTPTVDEDSSLTLTTAMFGYADEEGDTFDQLTVGAIPTYQNATLQLNGFAVTDGQQISAIDIAAGLLVLDTTNTDASLGDTIDFTVSASSVDGQSSSAATFTAQITPVNDVPTLSPILQPVNEDSSLTLTPAMFGYTDEEGDAFDQLTITSVPTFPNASLLLNGAAVADGQQISEADITAGLLVLDTTNTDASLGDTIDFTVSATSSAGQSSPVTTFTAQITPVNDIPTLSSIPQSVKEDSSVTLTPAMFGYADEEGDAFDQLTITSVPTFPNASLLLNGAAVADGQQISEAEIAAGLLVLDTTNTDANSGDTITFTVAARSADGQFSTDDTFNVQLVPVNDAPTLSPMEGSINENSRITFTTSMLEFGDEESDIARSITIIETPTYPGSKLTLAGFDVVDGQTIAVADIDAGLLEINVVNTNATAGDVITFNAFVTTIDNQSSASTPFNFSLNAINDIPKLMTNSTPISVDEGHVVFLSGTEFDVQDEELSPVAEFFIAQLPSEPGVTVEKSGVPLAIGDSFTPQDLNLGAISVNAENSPVLATAADQLVVFARLGDNTTTNLASVPLQFEPVADNPTLFVSTSIAGVEDGSIPLPENLLVYTDADNDDLLEYQINQVLSTPGFSIQKNGVILVTGDTFTATELSQGLVEIASDGTHLHTQSMDEFSIFAVSVRGEYSPPMSVEVQLNPNDDTPTLSTSQPINLFENEINTLTTGDWLVQDDDGDTPISYTLIQSIPSTLGVVTVKGSPILAGETFTHVELKNGQVQIDLSDAELLINANTELQLSVNTGPSSSSVVAVPISVTAQNDAPKLANAIILPPIGMGSPATISTSTFVDPENDSLTHSVAVNQIDGEPVTDNALPAWITFDPQTMTFELLKPSEADSLLVVVTAADPSGAKVASNVLLEFEPPLAAANPEPILEPVSPTLSVIDAPVTEQAPVTTLTPEPAEPIESVEVAGTEPENSEEQGRRSVGFIDEIPTTDIQSARIDLAALLPALERSRESDSGSASANTEQTANLADFLGLTNDVNSLTALNFYQADASIYQNDFDNLADLWDSEDELLEESALNFNTTVGSSVGISSGFTVGYMIWLLRGGTLMGSMLSSLPAWRLVDPLPVLAELDGGLDDDNESLESMLDKADEAHASQEEHSENEVRH